MLVRACVCVCGWGRGGWVGGWVRACVGAGGRARAPGIDIRVGVKIQDKNKRSFYLCLSYRSQKTMRVALSILQRISVNNVYQIDARVRYYLFHKAFL